MPLWPVVVGLALAPPVAGAVFAVLVPLYRLHRGGAAVGAMAAAAGLGAGRLAAWAVGGPALGPVEPDGVRLLQDVVAVVALLIVGGVLGAGARPTVLGVPDGEAHASEPVT